MYKITLKRKTYYLLGILAVACTMAGAVAVLSGSPMTLLDNTGFVLTGMTFLLLAAVADSPAQEKTRYFACFVVLLFSTIYIADPVNYLLAGLYWPLFAWAELKRDRPVERPARLVAGAEALCFVFRMLAGPGGQTAFYNMANVFWLLDTAARGWLVLSLYQHEKTTDTE